MRRLTELVLEQLDESIDHRRFLSRGECGLPVTLGEPPQQRGIRDVRSVRPIEHVRVDVQRFTDRGQETLVIDVVRVGERAVDVEDDESPHE